MLVAGPSGAGKDTLLGRARLALGNDPRCHFARRTVTRASSQWEDHDTLDETAFALAKSAGQFSLTWTAHGLCYGLDRAIEQRVADGQIVIANVSRAVIGQARERFPDVHVILIDADPEVRTARVRARGREPAAASRQGEGRTALDPGLCETVIDNSGTVDAAAAQLEQVLCALIARLGGDCKT